MKKIIALLLLLAPASAAGQETPDTFQLREVVVSSTRMPQARRTVTSAVSVIGSEEFERLGLRNAADVLRTLSGTSLVQGGSYGAFASMFMRGGESDYVQVLLDGIQINSPGEHFDFANLSLENIERIEVVKGPVSVLYGSDAAAGVVQLFSRRARNRTRAHLTALAGRGDKVGAAADGSFNSVDLRGDIAGGSPNFSYSIGASHFGSEGALAYNNEYRLSSGTVRLGAQLDDRSDAALTVRAAANRFRYPTDGSGNLTDLNQYHDAGSVALGMDAGHRFSNRTELRGQLSWNRNQDDYHDAPDSPADTLGFYGYLSNENFRRSSLDLRLNQEIAAGSILTLGGEIEQQSRKGSSLSQSEFGEFPDATRNDRANRAGYAQLLGSFGRVSMQTGLRIDDNERFGEFFTYRGGIAVQLSGLIRARGSFGTGFKEPRFFEQFATGFVRGNPELTPERSRSLDGGIDVGTAFWSVGATVFAQSFRDLIQYIGTAPADAPNYMNVGRVTANGAELEGHFQSGRFNVRASLTLLETNVEEAGAADDPLYQQGDRLIRRPGRNGAIAFTYSRGFSASTVINFVGERVDLDFANFPAARVQLPSYIKVDATIRTPPFGGIRGVVRIENVLNEEYQEVLGFPARGRVIFLGMSL